MNIRVKAGLVTAGLLAASLCGVLLIQLVVNFLTPEQFMMLLGLGFVAFFINVLYGITLNRLEYEQKLKEITSKTNT